MAAQDAPKTRAGGKLSQAELLERLSPIPFTMKNVVPEDAKIAYSDERRWWRSDSPDRTGEGHLDVPRDPVDVTKSATRGVLGNGVRSGPGMYQTSYQCGSGTAAHFKDETQPKNISGYSGMIPGKYAGNCVGSTYVKSNEDAIEHLKSTAQSMKWGPMTRGHDLPSGLR
eukprot:TRINITY_DN3017_c0_g1_i13.p1 TRINITY_DN3017_c0_g1~~TRINITY_DN3017_c0_g1_i13.p1  ORF type:complete len:170 (+),score=25.92 TRINITY_DN3017_c0_g1_i13:94-603(+)